MTLASSLQRPRSATFCGLLSCGRLEHRGARICQQSTILKMYRLSRMLQPRWTCRVPCGLCFDSDAGVLRKLAIPFSPGCWQQLQSVVGDSRGVSLLKSQPFCIYCCNLAFTRWQMVCSLRTRSLASELRWNLVRQISGFL